MLFPVIFPGIQLYVYAAFVLLAVNVVLFPLQMLAFVALMVTDVGVLMVAVTAVLGTVHPLVNFQL